MNETCIDDFEWLGCHPGLDFANTINHRFTAGAADFLSSYENLAEWAVRAGLVTRAQARRMVRAASDRPGEAAAAVARAVDLRELVYRIFLGVIRGGKPKAKDIGALSRHVAKAAAHRELEAGANGIAWKWRFPEGELDALTWPVVWEAAALLSSGQLGRVKECPAPDGCGWLFLDCSKNRSRRWCSMANCGNTSKVKRHYRKKRAACPA